MCIQNLLDQFIGSANSATPSDKKSQGIGDTVSKLTSNIPGGPTGGAAAGGIMALLMSNKKARKFTGKVAAYGGAAMLGGLAYKALKNWQQNNLDKKANVSDTESSIVPDKNAILSNEIQQPAFELTLIKAMIAAAKADGHIDNTEQQRIFNAVDKMNLSTEYKGMVFDLLRQQISVEELAKGADSIEQKTELYLASCLAINPDHPSEQAHLDQLSSVLELPQDLTQELQWQAQKAIAGSV